MGAIVVAVDGTEASTGALVHARTIAHESGRTLTGVFVIDAGWADFIGNDWQSSRNARQGFLDYVRDDQQRQSEKARMQFTAAFGEASGTRFRIVAGEPVQALAEFVERERAEALVLGRNAFRECGRPSAKRLGTLLARRLHQPVHLV